MNMSENNKLPPLYGKTSSGKLQIWYTFTEGNAIHVIHGLCEGKKQEKITYAKGKNKGKSNETSDDQQAILEAQSKWQHQRDRGYFETKEEALAYVAWEPMKAQSFEDQAKKIVFPCYGQPKLDGCRVMIPASGNAVSKSGLDLALPSHWSKGLRLLEASGLLSEGLDGEVYAGLVSDGGLSLQEIVSAFRKENENTHKLEYYVYDIPGAGAFEERVEKLAKLNDYIVKLSYEGVDLPIRVVYTAMIENAEAGDALYEELISRGYEGMMYRNANGLYEHGKRSYDLIKRKGSVDFEALVLSVEEDKNGDGVMLCKTVNGEHIGSEFRVLMRIDAAEVNYRKYENALTLIGKTVTVQAESYSLDGVPTKPRGIAVRETDQNGQPLY